MELLLNLVWMLLALPAWWLWRQRGDKHRGFNGYQCLLALACLVVLLFPVISASDDLNAMRTEMEESGSAARSVRVAETGKSAHALKGMHAAAMAAVGIVFTSGPSRWYEPAPSSESGLVALCMEQGGRAPPSRII